jgi:hypothetical protein
VIVEQHGVEKTIEGTHLLVAAGLGGQKRPYDGDALRLPRKGQEDVQNLAAACPREELSGPHVDVDQGVRVRAMRLKAWIKQTGTGHRVHPRAQHDLAGWASRL